MKNFVTVLPLALALLLVGGDAFAQDLTNDGVGAGIAMGLAVLGGALGQGLIGRGMLESVSRNPQAAGKLNAPFYVGLAFVESLALFAILVVYMIQ